jgi:L-fucose isomerase-like protein
MRPLKIGLLACVHPLYDVPGVAAHRQAAIEGLRNAGCEVIAAETPRSPADAAAVARAFRRDEVDLALLFFCTWVAEEITLAFARELMDVPMLLWALPYLDKHIPMPSPISGLLASASGLRRMGTRCPWQIGAVSPEHVERAVRTTRAAHVVRLLRGARFGILGDPCPGMADVEVDDTGIQRTLGITTVHLDLDALVAASVGAPPEEAASAAERLMAAAGGGNEIGPDRLRENLTLYAGLEEIVRSNRLDAYCVRCWPELRDRRQVTPCAAHALLSEDGIPNCCEVDLTALVTTWVLSRLANAPAFTFDTTGYLEEEAAVQFGHCGAAAPSLAGDRSRIALRSHMRTGTGATVEFPFPEGRVTLAKLTRPSDGSTKLFVAGGTVIPCPEGTRGSVAGVRPHPSADAFLETVLREGVEHHIALVYGSWETELRLFCEFTGIEFLPAGQASGRPACP